MPKNETVETIEDVFDEIEGMSDEEIRKSEAKAEAKPADGDASGDATEDRLTAEEAKALMDDTNDETEVKDPGPGDQATGGTTQPDLTSKVSELEAELKKERQRTASWDGRIKAANEKAAKLEADNEQLRAEIEQLKTSGSADSANSEAEVMATFKETFPELVEVLDIYQRKIDSAVKSIPAKATPKEEPAAKEPEEDTSNVDNQKHFDEILAVHPDLNEAVHTGVLQTWINRQDDFIRPHLQNVYNGGTSQQVIKLMANFKKKSGWTSQLDTGKDKRDKLKSMIATDGESPGPKTEGPDKNDFAGAAKEAGL